VDIATNSHSTRKVYLLRLSGFVVSPAILSFLFSPFSISPKRWALFWPTLSAIIQLRRGNVGMPQPLLHFGNVGIVRQCIGRRGGTQGMHAEAVHIRVDAY
jgi:hypothetical protein